VTWAHGLRDRMAKAIEENERLREKVAELTQQLAEYQNKEQEKEKFNGYL